MKIELERSVLPMLVASAASIMLLSGCRTEVMTARENLDPADRDTISSYPGRDEMIARQTLKTTKASDPVQDVKTAQSAGGIAPMETMSSTPISSSGTAAVSGGVSAKGGSYTVVGGDSLDRIARRHGTTVGKLAAYNSIDVKKVLRVGQVLQIPPSSYKTGDVAAVKPAEGAKKVEAAKTADLPSDGLYIVKPNDSIDRIARRFKIKRADLFRLNNLNEKSILRVGQKLILPGGAADKGGAPAAADTAVAVTAAPRAANAENELDLLVRDLEKGQAPATTAPAAANAAADSPRMPSGSMLEVLSDTPAADFAARNNVTLESLKQANAGVWPADGVLKAGTLVVLP